MAIRRIKQVSRKICRQKICSSEVICLLLEISTEVSREGMCGDSVRAYGLTDRSLRSLAERARICFAQD